jgi:hypothetical protein
MTNRVGQTWNFPLRCEDGIHFVTATVVETQPHSDPDFGEAHRVLVLDSSSETDTRKPGSLFLVSEPGWKIWDNMSSWTRLG